MVGEMAGVRRGASVFGGNLSLNTNVFYKLDIISPHRGSS